MDMDTPSRSATSALFAEQLRAERAARRLSRAELAKASGVSAKAIQRLEENEREMDTDQIDRLCRALGVSVLDFVTRAAERMPPADRGTSKTG
jgi:Predicted transcriptional regulators